MVDSTSPVAEEDFVPGQVTFFSSLVQPEIGTPTPVGTALDSFRDGKYKSAIEAIRTEKDPEKRSKLKKQLSLICFAGLFSYRSTDCLEVPSGLLCLDLDKIPDDQFPTERSRIQSLPYVYSVFRSPSGQGLKLLVRVPTADIAHGHITAALKQAINSPYLDQGAMDISRGCYVTYDPELFINPKASPFQITEGKKKKAAIKAKPVRSSDRGKVDPSQAMDRILAKIKTVDFRKLARSLEVNQTVPQKRLVVLIIDQVIERTTAAGYGMIRQGEIYLFNGAYWEQVHKERLLQFLSSAAVKMGLNDKDVRHFGFVEDLWRQLCSEISPAPRRDQGDTVNINLTNGMLEVRSDKLKLRNPKPEDFCKYQLPFTYDPAATSPIFRAFLDEVLPDPQSQDILAEYIGYLFVPVRVLKLEKVLFLYGKGANGKSVFFDVVRAMLGESRNVCFHSPAALADQNSYCRADLQGRLLNYASEIDGRMDVQLMKLLASGEPIHARLPYGQPFLIEEYAKMMFNCNTLPRNVESTSAFYRRLLIIPFNVTISEEQQDKDLAKKIIAKELSGVFNWVLEGLQRILGQRRFSDSTAVNNAVQEYRSSSEVLGDFIAALDLRPSAYQRILQTELYDAFSRYCIDRQIAPMGIRSLGTALKDLGLTTGRSSKGTYFNCEWARESQDGEKRKDDFEVPKSH